MPGAVLVQGGMQAQSLHACAPLPVRCKAGGRRVSPAHPHACHVSPCLGHLLDGVTRSSTTRKCNCSVQRQCQNHTGTNPTQLKQQTTFLQEGRTLAGVSACACAPLLVRCTAGGLLVLPAHPRVCHVSPWVAHPPAAHQTLAQLQAGQTAIQ
jgi:hypothetical protein